MADGDKDILQLHFGIDIRDVDTKVNQIKDKLGSIVTSYQENIGKLKDLFSEVFEPPKGANETDKATSAFDKYMAKLDRIKEKADSFSSMNSRIRKELRQTILSGTNDLQNVESALTRIANLFDKGMNITNFRGLTETQGAFSQFAHALAEFRAATHGKNSLELDEIQKKFQDSVSRITRNWNDLRIVLAGGSGWNEFNNLTAKNFANVLSVFEKFKSTDSEYVSQFFETLTSKSASLQKLSDLFLSDRTFGGEKFSRALESQLQKGISQGLDTAYGAITTNLANLGKAVQEFPSGTEAKLQEFGRGLASVTGLLSNSEIGMNASSIVDLLNSAGSAVQIDGEQLAKAIQDKMKSVRIPVALKPDPNSITPQVRDEVQTKLNAKPLTIPVEFVFETGAKRVENAAKAAAQATEKSMTFSTELEELKAYREYLNATAIDAATFREKLDSVYENLFPRRNRPSLADNELLPQADKLIAEMEDKAAKLADASAKATARQQLMIGGDAIEAFRVDAQAKLDAMKPLEFTNIKLKASTVDASGIKEAVGLDKLESNAKLLKSIAVPLSKLDVSNAKPVNADILQKNFDAMVNLTIPISRLTFSDDVSKMDTTKLKDNVDTLGNKLVLPIYKADLENVRAIQSGEEVSKKISDLAHLVAYIQSIDLSKAQIENQEGLEAKVKEFANKLKQNFTKMGDELSKEIKIPFLEQKNINRMFAYARAIKTIADSMKYLNGLQETIAKLDSSKLGMARSIANAEAAGNPDPALMMEADVKKAKSEERVKERVKTHQDEIDRLKDSIEMQKALQNVSEQAEKASSNLPLGGGKNDTALLAEKSKTLETFNAAIREDIGLQETLQDRFRNDAELAKHFGGSMADAKNRLDAYTESLRKVASMTGSGWIGGMSGEFQSASMEFEKMYRSMGAAKMRFDELVKAVKAGRFDIRGGGMNIAGLDVTALKRLQAEMRTTGDSFTEMMRTMGFYITGRSVITFFQNAIKSASQFSMEIRRIQSLATTFDFDRIKTGLESLDARFGNLIHNAKALYWAFSSGVRGTEEELVRFTETMSKTAITIGSDVMPVMDAATTLMNAYGKSAASAGEISDLLFTIVKEGKANGQQLASSIGNIIAPASAMGLTFKDIGATISTLTRTMKTNNALTYLNNILAKMNNPTKEVQSQLDKLGLEINATAIKAKGFAQVMREIHEATRGDINLIAKIFPDIRGQRAAVTLFSTQFGEFQKQLQNFGNMSGNMQEALSKITDNPEAQFAALRNGFEMIRQAAGDAAINVVTLGGALTPIFSAVNGMKSFGRSVAGHIAGLAALGVVMNMLGKARLMLESANISAIQQMNLAYVEQSKAIGDSVMAMRKQEELNQANRVAVMENWSKQKLANDAEYQSLLNEQKQLEARQSLLNARREEFKVALNIAQADRDALKNAEELALMNRKSELAYEKFSASLTARTGIPNQWGLEDSLSKAGAYIRSFRNETDLKAKTSGLATGDLQAVVDAAVAEAFRKNPNNIDQATVAATVAKMAGVAATDAIKNEVINRRVAEATMQKMLADANDMFKSWVKDGKNPEFLGSLTTKIDALNSVMQQRVQDARAVSISLDDLYSKLSLTTEQRTMLVEIMKEENDVAAKLSGTESALLRIQNEAGGEAYKVQLEAQKALAQSYASANKLHAANIQNIISEMEAQVKNAAAKRDAAAAEAARVNGMRRLNDYIVQHNLQLGKEVQSLRALQKEYKALAAMMAYGPLTKEDMARMQQIGGMNLISARLAQYGQFGGGSGALEGFRNAANAGRRGFLSELSRASFLPIIGGPLGMITRPLSMMGDALKKATVYITLTTSALVKNTVAWMANKKAINAAILENRRLTMWQALASTSMSKFGGTMLNTALSFRGVVASAQALHMTFGGVIAGMTAIGITGGVVIGALALLTGKLLGLTEDGGPLAGFAKKIYGIDKALKQTEGYDKSLELLNQQTARRKEYAHRLEILQEETRYTIGAYDALGRMNGIEIGALRERERMLQNYASHFDVLKNNPYVKEATDSVNNAAKRIQDINRRMAEAYQDFNAYHGEERQSIEAAREFNAEMERLRNELGNATDSYNAAVKTLQDAKENAKDLEPGLVGMIEAYEMLDEIESNRMDILASEATNTMRVAMLQKKINDTNKRIVLMLEGESEYAKMEHLAASTAAAYNAYKIEERKLAQLKKDKVKEDSDQYKEQEKAVEAAEKVLQEAQTAQDNFRNSYVNYKKTQVQHLQEQIKLDREMAELSRKSEALRLDMDAMTGRGTFATAEKLALALSNSHKLMNDEMEAIRARNNAFFQGNMKMAAKGGMSDFAKALRSLSSFNLSQVASSSKALAISLGGLFQNFAKWNANNTETNPEKMLPESRVLEIRKMQMDALKALTDFWQKVVTDMANIVKQSKNAIDDIQINRLREIMRGDRKLNPFDVNNTAAFQRQRGELSALQKKQADLQMKYNAAVMDELKQRARLENAQDVASNAMFALSGTMLRENDAAGEMNNAVATYNKAVIAETNAHVKYMEAQKEAISETGVPSIMQKQVLMPIAASLAEKAAALAKKTDEASDAVEWEKSRRRQAGLDVIDAEQRYAAASDALSKETAREIFEKSKAIKEEMKANADAIAAKQNEIKQSSAMLRYNDMRTEVLMRRRMMNMAALEVKKASSNLAFRRGELVDSSGESEWREELARRYAAEYAEQGLRSVKAGKEFNDAYALFLKRVREYGDSLAHENPNVSVMAMDEALAARKEAVNAAKKSHEADEELARRHVELSDANEKARKALSDREEKEKELAGAAGRMASAIIKGFNATLAYNTSMQKLNSAYGMELKAQARREWILRNGTYEQKGGVLKGALNGAIVRDQRLIAQMRGELAQGWAMDKDGNKVVLDEAARAKRLSDINELSQSVRKNMDSYIDVQVDLVKRSNEARNGVLQLAQSLQKFRSVAVDAVDAMSSEAFSMRFRSFSGLKELPQMRTTTREEQNMNENMERRDEYFTELNKFLAEYAQQNGQAAEKQYAEAIKGLSAAANSFKTAAETFDRAVQRPLTVNVNAVDVFGGRQ